jgi:uncharacterized protein (UPF0297 family)
MINSQEKNINRYKSISELDDFINKFDVNEILEMTPGEWSKAVNNAKNNIRKFYEDNLWLCVIPENMYAACYWGSGTEWCTAVRNNENYFDSYYEDGDLIILINKQTKEKYQFHFASEQYMDKKDKPIAQPVLTTIGASDGLMGEIKLYCFNEVDMPDEYFYLRYNIVNGDEEIGFCLKNPDGTYSYIDGYEEELYPGYTFLTCYSRNREYLPAKFIYNGNTYVNILDAEGETLFEYDDLNEIVVVDYLKCVVKSEKYKGYNVVNLDTGQILFDKWLSKIEKNGSQTIVTDRFNKQNIVSAACEKVFNTPVETIVTNPYNGTLKIGQKIDGKIKWNVCKGDVIRFPEWYDNIEFKINPVNQDVGPYSQYNLVVRKNDGEPAELVYVSGYDDEVLISDVDEIGDLVYCAYNIHGVIVRKGDKYNFFQFVWRGGQGLCGTYLDTWVDKLEIANSRFFHHELQSCKHELHALLNGQWHTVGFSRNDEKLKMLPIVDQDKKL